VTVLFDLSRYLSPVDVIGVTVRNDGEVNLFKVNVRVLDVVLEDFR